MTFFKTTFLSKYWIRSSQIAGFFPNNTKIFLGEGGKPLPPPLISVHYYVDRYFWGQLGQSFFFLKSTLLQEFGIDNIEG